MDAMAPDAVRILECLTLNDKFIHVAGKSTYAPQAKNPKGEVHEDVGFISYDTPAQKLVLRQFHVEGFVNHSVLESISEDDRTRVFVSVAVLNGRWIDGIDQLNVHVTLRPARRHGGEALVR